MSASSLTGSTGIGTAGIEVICFRIGAPLAATTSAVHPSFRSALIASALWLAACGSDPGLVACDEGAGEEPVVVTGLSGLLDGSTPAIEIVQLVPETCEETDRVWMLFEDPGAMVTIGPEPSGILRRGEVEVTDTTIFFRALNVGVRLEYPDGTVAPTLRLVWFTSGMDLATVDCTTAPLECVVQEE